MKILLVEDNPGDARLLREALADVAGSELRLTHVERLSEGQRRIGEERFDAVLLDLSLPDAKGLDAVLKLKIQAPELPVVVLTGLDDQDLAVKALHEGAQDYLVKGEVEGSTLLRALRYAIERKKIQEELKRQQERIRALHEINVSMTSTLDLKGVLQVLVKKIEVFLPGAAATVWLLNRESGLLEQLASCNVDREALQKRILADPHFRLREALERGTPVRVRDMRSDPHTRHPDLFREQQLVSFLGLPLHAKGETLGVLALYTKVEHAYTDEEVELFSTLAGQAAMAIYNARLHEQVKRQAAELEEANRMQADFAAMIAHDLRSPLLNIVSVAGMMEDGLLGPINDEQKKWLGKIHANSHALVDMVSDFLDLSRLEAGHIDLAKTSVELKPLIETVVENYLPRCNEKNISLRCDVDSALRPINADARRLDQVLSNLLSNAVKFTPGGGTIEVGARQRGDKETLVWVKDNGVGIPPAEVATLFEKYRQGTSGKNSAQTGTGLGLVICKMIVEAHGGKIWTESAEGVGSTFSFSLPTTG